MVRSPFGGIALALCTTLAAGGAPADSVPDLPDSGPVFFGHVLDAEGTPLPGAMVSVASPKPVHRVTVYSGEDGSYRTPVLPFAGPFELRVRRIGWKDLTVTTLDPGEGFRDFRLARENDPAAVAAQLPANYWMNRVLDRLDEPRHREEFLRQCGYCHQQGSLHTRVARDSEEWSKVILLMGRRGAMISADLRALLPAVFIEAYDPATAVPELTAGMTRPGYGPVPQSEVRHAVIEEWDLGGPGSMQHDVMVHPSGHIYGVDMPFDKLHRLDPASGERKTWDIPPGDLPIGGVFAKRNDSPASSSRVGPHSLQTGPGGEIWITLATGNQLARFDPKTEAFEIIELDSGFYPHTLRIDDRGRVWYTISASNHLGVYDPASGEHRQIRLPARDFKQAMILRAMPFLMWLNRNFDLQGMVAKGDPVIVPIPYGIDIAPDGSVWFSQLNEHRIGRLDPDTGEIEVIDTPFPAPRRLRFDSKGKLWIPSFSGGRIARFDPQTRRFEEWELPTEPRGSETPYALHVDRTTDTVWICGTASDTLLSFEPEAESWRIYPLPTRVTFTREIDFDSQGRIWTSNSNGPAWQIEDGVPRVLRLDPRGVVAHDEPVEQVVSGMVSGIVSGP